MEECQRMKNVLQHIKTYNKNWITVYELCSAFKVSRQSLHETLQVLLNREYVQRKSKPGYIRRYMYSITEKGMNVNIETISRGKQDRRTMKEIDVLKTLKQKSQISSDLEVKINVTQGCLNKILNTLLNKGLIGRCYHPDIPNKTKYSYLYYLTNEGLNYLNEYETNQATKSDRTAKRETRAFETNETRQTKRTTTTESKHAHP